MNPHIQQYYQFVKEQLRHDPKQSHDSILDQLWQLYSIGHMADSSVIRKNFQTAESILAPLSQKRQRALLNTIVDLCLEHEHIAFIEGIQIGAQLAAEIFKQETE